jgi:RNA polymerase sigma factor (sigma-70 family)
LEGGWSILLVAGIAVRFETTNWSVIVEATTGDTSAAKEALAALCESYWPPIYSFIRGKGHSPSDAEDLTQAYFARFLEKRYLEDFRPEAGRFRTFLRASVGHFLANEWDREKAQKRGGGKTILSLDVDEAEERWRREPVDRLTPEAIFERQWAAAMLARCLARLREEHDDPDRRGRFDKLKPHLVAGGSDSGYEGLARELGTSEAAARVAVHRLRKRFSAVLREEVARTVAAPGDVDAEIRWLLTTVRTAG